MRGRILTPPLPNNPRGGPCSPVKFRYAETECACDLCGLDLACGDRAHGEADTDGSLSWLCDECWRELCEGAGELLPDAWDFDEWDVVGGL